MRANPLDNTRGPNGRAVLTIAAASVVVLGAAGFGAHLWNTGKRVENVQRAVAAAGYGAAEVTEMKGPECWRAREGFRWKTATAEGWACAGPRDQVVVHRGEPNGRWP